MLLRNGHSINPIPSQAPDEGTTYNATAQVRFPQYYQVCPKSLILIPMWCISNNSVNTQKGTRV